jgi:hypothetical protein
MSRTIPSEIKTKQNVVTPIKEEVLKYLREKPVIKIKNRSYKDIIIETLQNPYIKNWTFEDFLTHLRYVDPSNFEEIAAIVGETIELITDEKGTQYVTLKKDISSANAGEKEIESSNVQEIPKSPDYYCPTTPTYTPRSPSYSSIPIEEEKLKESKNVEKEELPTIDSKDSWIIPKHNPNASRFICDKSPERIPYKRKNSDSESSDTECENPKVSKLSSTIQDESTKFDWVFFKVEQKYPTYFKVEFATYFSTQNIAFEKLAFFYQNNQPLRLMKREEYNLLPQKANHPF